MKQKCLLNLLALFALLFGGGVSAYALPTVAADGEGGDAENYVAEIVETGAKYTSYSDAISAMKSSGVSQTVKLLANVDMASNDTNRLPDGLTLDLNGFELQLFKSEFLTLDNEAKVTITDGSDAKTGRMKGGQYWYIFSLGVGAQLTINGGTFECNLASEYPYLFRLYIGCKIEINGGKFEAPLTDANLVYGTITPKGGEYKYNFNAYVPDSYAAELQEDGYYKAVDNELALTYGETTEKLQYTNQAVTIDFRDGDATAYASWLSKVSVPQRKSNIDVTLQKNFANTGWNSFCAPFEIKSVPDGFEIAEIWDTELVGDATTIEFKKLASGGSIAAYTPCLIRATQVGRQDVTFSGVTLRPSEDANTTIDCSSVKQKFTFTGVMENTALVENHGWYVDAANQTLQYDFDESAYVTPFKFYMQIQNRANDEYVVPAPSAQARKVAFRVIGDSEATGIADINADSQRTADSRVYNLQGAVVGTSLEGLPAGVYVKNGRKVVVK